MSDRLELKGKESNIIVRMVEGWCDFETKVIETVAQAKIKIDNVNHTRYKNEAECLPLKMEIEELKIQAQAMKKIRKRSRVYSMLAAIGTFASVLLTVCGITGCENFGELFASAQNLAYILMIFFTQYVVYYVGKDSTLLKNNFFINYNYFVALKVGITFTSVTCNYIFLIRFMKTQNFIYYIFLLILACSLDLISLTLSAMANDCRNLQYSYKNYDADVSALTMIGFLISEKIKRKIRTSYNNKLESYRRDVLKLADNDGKTTTAIAADNINESLNYNLNEILQNYKEISDKTKEKTFEKFEPNLNQNTLETSEKFRQETTTQNEKFEPNIQKNDKINSNEKIAYKLEERKVLNNISKQTDDINVDVKKQQNKAEKLIKNQQDKEQEESMKRNNNMYENAVKRLEAFADDERVSKSKLGLRLKEKDWRKIRAKLIEKGLVYTKGSYTYKATISTDNKGKENNKI